MKLLRRISPIFILFILSACKTSGVAIDATGEQGGGTQPGGGGMAFLILAAFIVIIAAVLFSLDRIKRK